MSGRSAFWTYSLKFYGRHGVADACVALQDSAGIDINCLFLLIYLSRGGRALDAGIVADIHAVPSAWRERVVMPLRNVRRYLKTPATEDPATAALRTDVKRLELEAEHLQQRMLEAAFPLATTGLPGTPRAALELNLDLFERHVGRPLPPGAFGRLRALARAEVEADC